MKTPQMRGRPWLVYAAMLLVVAGAGGATPYYVDDANGDDGNNGLSWGTAKKTIQAAVNLTVDGDTVWVTNGTYNITAQISITNGITVRSVEGADVTTVRRSGGTTRVFYIDHPDAIVEGLTIRDGNAADGSGVRMTGGMLVSCVVTNNLGPNNWSSGGGIYMTGGVVSNSVITRNRGTVNSHQPGGGIWAGNAGCLVVNSVIRENYGASTGGGMRGGTARNCLFVGNSTAGDGGGARDVALQNCTLVNNTASNAGGGAFGGSAINTISYFNTAATAANRSGGTWTYSCTTPLPAGAGNIDTDPQFFDPDAGDYRLLPGSDAIDAGTNLVWMTGATDLDGNPRIYNDTVDMGAFERMPGALQANFIADPTTGLVAPLMTVAFTAVVDGTNTTGLDYQWDFTNSGVPDETGSDKHVVTNHYAPGNYTVSLTVTNAAGESSTLTKVGYIMALGENVYVSPDGDAIPPYASWATAANDLQSAIDVSLDGTVIRVSNGVYSVATQIGVNKGVIIRSLNGPDVTHLRRGSGTTRVLYLNHPDAVIDGLTIRDGNAGETGSGIYMTGGLLVNCVVTNNLAPQYWVQGGGIYMTGGVVSNSIIVANRGSENRDGAGIYAANAGCLVVNSVISGNWRSQNAGGMDGGTARNCLFVGNSTLGNGGGARNVVLQNCTLVNNTAANTGGGASGGSAINTISYFNTAASGANRSGGTWTYSCTTPLPDGVGNIDTDPQFFDPDAGDYRLLPGSYAIDEGTNLVWMTGATDLDGNPRIYNETVDMGAFERVPGRLQANFIADPATGLAAPLMTVVFTAVVDGTNSTGLDYQWDFTNSGIPDETGSDKAVVTNHYAPGNYTVSLTVTNAVGESSTVTKTAYIMALGENVYVSLDGDSMPPYASWATAANDLQSAIDASLDGTVIWVSNGVYSVSATVSVGKGVTIRSLDGPDVTHLRRGSGTIRVLFLDHPDAVIDGLTIRDGNAGETGSGIYMAGGLLVNCVVTNNLAPQYWVNGGGIHMTGGVVSNSVITRNRGSENRSGAGIYAANAGCLVVNSIISGNWQSGSGGGMDGGTARNCLFVGNATLGNGGGANGVALQNCTLANNTAGGSGGGAVGGSVINSIIYGNSAPANPATDNYSGGSFSYSCTTPLPAGEGNIDADPLFVGAAAGNFRPAYKPIKSPAIDAGLLQAWMEGATDLDGHPRVQNQGVDMGAYETYVPLQGSLFLLR